MSNRAILVGAALLILCAPEMQGQSNNVPLSFDQSLELLQENNKSIQMAKMEVEIAHSEHQRLNSFWYPNISAAGTYMHMSNKIEVKEPLNQLTDPVKELVQSHFPGTEITQIISGLLDKVGAYTLSFPLAPQNVATIDANLMWPIFTGGKRIYGNKIGKSMVNIAQLNHHQISALSQVMLVDTYYALRLGKRVVEVKKEAFDALYKEYQNAVKLEQNGMINKAERLVVQVGMEEAKREHEAAVKDYAVAQSAFRGLLNMQDTTSVEPTSALFINDSIPSAAYFKSLVPQNNYMLAGLGEQKKIAKYQENIGKTGYAPNIALIGKQTIFSHGIEKNLIPRTMIGVGFTWNIFDGLDREKKIKQAKLAGQTLQLGKEKAQSEINVGIDKFHSQMEMALDNVNALNTTIALSKELLKMRQKSFIEGMATSTEVVDAQVMLAKVQVAYLLAYYQYDSALMNLLALCGMPEEFSRYKTVGKTEHFIFE